MDGRRDGRTRPPGRRAPRAAARRSAPHRRRGARRARRRRRRPRRRRGACRGRASRGTARRACPRRSGRAARCGSPRRAETPPRRPARRRPHDARRWRRRARRTSRSRSSRSSTARPTWWTLRGVTPRCYSRRRGEPAQATAASASEAARSRTRTVPTVSAERRLAWGGRRAARGTRPGRSSPSRAGSRRDGRAGPGASSSRRLRLGVRVIREPCLLGVAHPLRLLRERVVVGAHRAGRGDVRHAEVEDHAAGDLRHLLEIARGAVRDAPEDDLLGCATAERDLHHVDQLLLRVEVALLDRAGSRRARARRRARRSSPSAPASRRPSGRRRARGRPRGRRGSASPSPSRPAASGGR